MFDLKKNSWEIKPSLTNEKKEIAMGIDRFYVLFSRMWKIGVI